MHVAYQLAEVSVNANNFRANGENSVFSWQLTCRLRAVKAWGKVCESITKRNPGSRQVTNSARTQAQQ
jgi:hypothetical protein